MGDMNVQEYGPPGGLTIDEVWAMLRETDRLIKEIGARTDRMSAETDRLIKERNAETDRRIQENDRLIKEMGVEADQRRKEADQQRREADQQRKEADKRRKELERQMKETDRKIGRLGNSLGDVIEHLMCPKLHKKFKKLNFVFNRSSRNIEIRDHDQNPLAEIDVLLENGEYAMAVEVKTRLTTQDVKDHVKRMGILRQVADERGDKRKYLGAVAGAVVTRTVAAYALKNGFYVIIPSGETVDIEAPEGFTPRIW